MYNNVASNTSFTIELKLYAVTAKFICVFMIYTEDIGKCSKESCPVYSSVDYNELLQLFVNRSLNS